MDNNKIKEAFEKWVDSSISIDEIVFISAQDTSERRLKASGFHGGYTAADRKWREKVEYLYRMMEANHRDVDGRVLAEVEKILGL